MKLVQYDNTYKELLEKYFKHSDTPINNASHKNIKTHLYDNKNGMLSLMIDNNEIVATNGIIIIEEDNIKSAKYPHRLHIRKDYSIYHSSFFDKFFDPALYNWLEKLNIQNVYNTINEGNERPLFWASYRHSRRNSQSLNHVNKFGEQIRTRNWYVFPMLVEEMHCWQYVAYSSPDDNWFYPGRKMKKINDNVANKMNKDFKFVPNLGWLI